MKRILLICPANAIEVFSSSKIRVAIPPIPYISLASLAGALIKAGHEVRILDLSVSRSPEADLASQTLNFKPDYAGITFTSALSNEAGELARRIKRISPGTVVIGGGVHPTTLPEETLANPAFDMAVIGEGEETIVALLDSLEQGAEALASVDGIAHRRGGAIIRRVGHRAILNRKNDRIIRCRGTPCQRRSMWDVGWVEASRPIPITANVRWVSLRSAHPTRLPQPSIPADA